jgi:hypothetical protein
MKQLLTTIFALFILTQAKAQLTEPDFIFIITNHKTVEDFDKYIREKGFVADTVRQAKLGASATKRCYKIASAEFPTVTFSADAATKTIVLSYIPGRPQDAQALKKDLLADGFVSSQSMIPNAEYYKSPAQPNTRVFLTPFQSGGEGEAHKSYVVEITKQFTN